MGHAISGLWPGLEVAVADLVPIGFLRVDPFAPADLQPIPRYTPGSARRAAMLHLYPQEQEVYP